MNDKYVYSKCKFCGQAFSYRTHSFMVDDGHGDVEWDQEEYCENLQCQSNNISLKTKIIDKNNKKIDKLINEFIKEWIPKYYSHLIDTDENDGQRLRNSLKKLINKK